MCVYAVYMHVCIYIYPLNDTLLYIMYESLYVCMYVTVSHPCWMYGPQQPRWGTRAGLGCGRWPGERSVGSWSTRTPPTPTRNFGFETVCTLILIIQSWIYKLYRHTYRHNCKYIHTPSKRYVHYFCITQSWIKKSYIHTHTYIHTNIHSYIHTYNAVKMNGRWCTCSAWDWTWFRMSATSQPRSPRCLEKPRRLAT